MILALMRNTLAKHHCLNLVSGNLEAEPGAQKKHDADNAHPERVPRKYGNRHLANTRRQGPEAECMRARKTTMASQ